MIFYFSCTGNTRWAAQKVAKATGEQTVDIAEQTRHNTNRTPTDCKTYSLGEGESIGFFFPVHGWRPPKVVRTFIANLHIANAKGHYCYAVCTAGDNVGEAMDMFEGDLSRVGLHIDSAISLIMPESFIGLPFMDVDKPAKEQSKKEAANQRLNLFIDDIKKRRNGIRDILVGHWPKTNSRFIGAAFVKWIIGDRQFRVDSNRCIKCGLCAKLCPVADIDGGNGQTPSWRHNGQCLSCFSCYHHCPVRAIEYGGRTKGKGQYYYKIGK